MLKLKERTARNIITESKFGIFTGIRRNTGVPTSDSLSREQGFPSPKPPDPPSKHSFMDFLRPPTAYIAPPSPRAVKKGLSKILPVIRQHTTYKGVRALFLREDEIIVAPFKFTLVGKFSHGYPYFIKIKKCFATFGLKGGYKIRILNAKQSLEEDYSRLWLKQTLFIEEESPIAPVWIRLLGLPIHLFDKRVLFNIARLIGKPLRIDEAILDYSRPSFARVCIGLNLMDEMVDHVWIGSQKRAFMQWVLYENPPKYCTHCMHLGHTSENCFVKGTKFKPPASHGEDLRTKLDIMKGKAILEEALTSKENGQSSGQIVKETVETILELIVRPTGDGSHNRDLPQSFSSRRSEDVRITIDPLTQDGDVVETEEMQDKFLGNDSEANNIA
ncbi:hypothetical protein Pfo_011418 [Paulownia fortunei]|nr:hypothetical protein Pfo_011418 [Paulownia fortunei]